MLRVIKHFNNLSLKVTEGHSKWHLWNRRVGLRVSIYWNCVCISYRLWVSQRQWCDLEIGVRDRSRLL